MRAEEAEGPTERHVVVVEHVGPVPGGGSALGGPPGDPVRPAGGESGSTDAGVAKRFGSIRVVFKGA